LTAVHSIFDEATERANRDRALVYSGPMFPMVLVKDFVGFGPTKS